MNLKELGNEYLKNIPYIEKRIAEKKREYKLAEKRGDFTVALALKHDIQTMREMKHDCLVYGNYLKNYYTKEGVKCLHL